MHRTLLAALLASAAVVPAQSPVCATGVIEPVGGPSICQQGETHRLAGTRVLLRSSTVNLATHVGQNVRIEGVDIGLLCTVVEVNVVTAPLATLEHCGTPMPGCAVKFKVGPGAIGRWALLASFGQAFQPLGCVGRDFLDGTLLLTLPAVTVGFGMFTGPFGEVVLAIPNVPALSGTTLWLQGARQDIGPVGPVEFTNSEVLQLVPFMPPCGGINC